MFAEMARALPAAAAAAVLPGYFWALVLRPASGLAERLAWSTVISMATVPAVAVVLARISSGGIGLWVALASVLIVLGSGALTVAWKGAAPGPRCPVLPGPPAVGDPLTLGVIAAVLVLALVTVLRPATPAWLLLATAAGVVAAGALAGWPAGTAAATERAGGPDPGPPPPAPPARPAPQPPPALPDSRALAGPPALPVTLTTPATGTTPASFPARGRYPALAEAALAAVLVLTGYRAYVAVIRYDWPFVPGGDQFSHAVMAEQMLAHGSYSSYLVYPPGFSALTAVICRFAGLTPLALFPVLAPTLLVVTALGAYALAARLWGPWYGVAAAGLSGLVLAGDYGGFVEGRYPDLLAAYFLVVMAVAALVSVYQAPSARSGALLMLVGASVVGYHQVAALYLAVLMALVVLTALPYLTLTGHRREARSLAAALAGVALLSAAYAAYIYDLPKLFTGHSATATAVSIALGSQPPLPPRHLLAELTPPVVWLGLLGLVVLVVSLRRPAPAGQVLTVVTVVLWCLFMYLGSRTSLDGFPQRFERDLGAPLSVTGALGLGVIGRSVASGRAWSRATVALAGVAAAGVAAVMLAVQAGDNLRHEARRGTELLTRPVAAAGAWLARHNTGGNIISTPYLNPGISNRAVLAMGGYTGLQSYSPRRIAHPRSLPTAGRQPLLDSQAVLTHPGTCQAGRILARDDIRYVVLYRFGTGANLAGFRADPGRYHRVFENSSVIIYATARTGCG